MSWLQDNWKTLAGFGIIGTILAYSPNRKTAKAARNPVKTTVKGAMSTEKARGHVCVDCGKTLRYGHPTPFGTGTAYRCSGCHFSGILSPMAPRMGSVNPKRTPNLNRSEKKQVVHFEYVHRPKENEPFTACGITGAKRLSQLQTTAYRNRATCKSCRKALATMEV